MTRTTPLDRFTGRRSRLVADRYRLVRELAAGGQGQVWQARDTKLDVDVAIKEVRFPEGASGAERAEMLSRARREARNAARLRDHPNIVAVYDVVVEDGKPWTVMRLVNGRSLASVLADRGRLPVNDVVDIAVSLLVALHAAHKAGIVHRDVKPANVMLAEDGDVLLADFGIAVHLAEIRLTRSGYFVGSPAYTAPERLLGRGESRASDLFSLGVTLFQATEGTLPFGGDTSDDVRNGILSAKPRPMEHAGPLAPLITRLLTKEPDNRPTIPQALALIKAPSAQAALSRLTSAESREAMLAMTAEAMKAMSVDPSDATTAVAETVRKGATRAAKTKLETMPGVTVWRQRRRPRPTKPLAEKPRATSRPRRGEPGEARSGRSWRVVPDLGLWKRRLTPKRDSPPAPRPPRRPAVRRVGRFRRFRPRTPSRGAVRMSVLVFAALLMVTLYHSDRAFADWSADSLHMSRLAWFAREGSCLHYDPSASVDRIWVEVPCFSAAADHAVIQRVGARQGPLCQYAPGWNSRGSTVLVASGGLLNELCVVPRSTSSAGAPARSSAAPR